MNPKQMLRLFPPVEPPPPAPPRLQAPSRTTPIVDHVTKILEPPAHPGQKVKKSLITTYMLNCFKRSSCPECGEHLIHLVCPVDTNTHYYTCEALPVSHKWTLVDDTI